MKTKTSKVLNALQNGDELTAKQITSRFGAKNPREVIRSLRNEGFAIYLNDSTDTKGNTVSKYRLGTPSRAMVRAYYELHGASDM